MYKMKLRNIRILRVLYYYYRTFESHHCYNHGHGNIVVNRGGVKVRNRIQFNGDNNKIFIEEGAVLKGTTIRITGSNCIVQFKKHSYVSEAEIFIEDLNCRVVVGEETFIGRHTHIACTEDNSSLIIGNKCMISASCQIRTGDSHSIIDLDGHRLNPAASVSIGNHCWMGEGSKVLKGVELGADCIVSTGAIVTKSFEPNCLLGGIPAKVLKKDISWDEKRL